MRARKQTIGLFREWSHLIIQRGAGGISGLGIFGGRTKTDLTKVVCGGGEWRRRGGGYRAGQQVGVGQ